MGTTVKVRVFDYSELSDEAQAHAYEVWRADREQDSYVPWEGENRDSVKAVIEALGFTLADWSIGGQGDYLIARGDSDDLDMYGTAAVAYVEEALPFKESCPFTGFYLDNECMEHVLSAVKGGQTIAAAVGGLADVWAAAREADIEQDMSLETFLDLETPGHTYLEDGTEWDVPAGSIVKDGE